MFKKISVFLLLIFSFQSILATTQQVPEPQKKDSRKPNQGYGATIYSDDYPTELINQKVYTINPQTAESEVLTPSQRQEILKKAKLNQAIDSWDHLEKDILILRASQYPMPELIRLYPQLPPGSLMKLQKLLKEQK